MKRGLLFTGLFILLLNSCNRIEEIVVYDGNDKVENLVFQAVIGDELLTKTAIQSNGTDIYWTPGDAINLFYGNRTSAKFTTSITSPAASASFQGSIGAVTGTIEGNGAAQSFWAVYPYNSLNTCDGTGVTLTIPGEQSGLAGTFADNLNPTIATSPGLDLVFYNVGSWFIFSVSRNDIVSVTFQGNASENLAGTVRVTMDGNSRPAVTQVTSGISSITMTPADGGCFIAGEKYYMVLIPQTLTDGYSLTLTTSNGFSATCVVSGSKDFVRSQFRGKLNADSGLTFAKEGNINFADANVKAICVANWDTNQDGELSYNEAAAVTTIPYSAFAKNTTITSFDEFQYFTGLTSSTALGYDSDYDEGMDYYGTFYQCSNLRSITLPSTLTTISYGCFRECTSLEEITIPSSVTKIQQVAFLGCENLIVHMESETPCTLQKDSYETYPDPYVFGFTTSGRVKAILVPSDEAVTAYKNAQYWPSSLIRKEGWVDPSQNITFKDAITELICVTLWDTNGDNCLSMSEAATVSDITDQFKGSEITSFDELKYFTNISSIPNETFKNCTKLTSISFPSSLTTIGSSALSGCSKLTKISVPSIDMWINLVAALKPFTTYSELYVGDNLVTEIVIPDGTENLASDLFSYLYKIEKVVLPEGLKSIGAKAFYICQSLSDINIPESLKTIGKDAFRGCISLSEISVGNVTSFGENAFYGCSKLTEIDLRSATGIPNGICGSCSSLTDVFFPSNVYGISGWAFYQCTSLTAVNIPASVRSIAESAFDGCTNLSQVIFAEEGLQTLGNAVFFGCSSLKEISLPKTLTNVIPSPSNLAANPHYNVIGMGAFYNSGLEKVTCYDSMLEEYVYPVYSGGIVRNEEHASKLSFSFSKIKEATSGSIIQDHSKSSVKEIVINKTNITYSIPKYAFQNFSNAETISLPAGITSIGNFAFNGCSKLEEITLYNTISSIGSYAFGGCKSLTSVSLPNGITSIGQGTFYNCSGLISITIPENVNSIGSEALRYCSNLQAINVLPTTPPATSGGVFDGSTCNIYVPAGTKDDYVAANGWSSYASRIVEQ